MKSIKTLYRNSPAFLREGRGDNSVQRIPLLAFNRIPAVALKTVPSVALNRITLLALNRIPA